MTRDELRVAIAEDRITREKLAELCGVDVRNVYRWLAGDVPVPGYAETILNQRRELRLKRENLAAAQAQD